MASGPISIILFTVFGGGGFCFFTWRLFAARRRQVREFEITAPQEKLLRPAGHTLQEEILGLVQREEEALYPGMAASCVGIGLLAASALGLGAILGTQKALSNPDGKQLLVLTLIGAFGGVCSLWRARLGVFQFLELNKKMLRARLGLRGEQAVAEALHSPEVAGAGYFTFHDVPKDGYGNIDHVVVGPGGVFVIETKARSQQRPRQNEKRTRLKFDGTTASFPWGGYDTEFPKQLARHVDALATWLGDAAPRECIQALLVFPGWEVHMTKRFDHMKALSTKQLRYYFGELTPCLSADQIKRICSLMDKRCRDVSM